MTTTKSTMKPDKKEIAFVVYPGCTLLELVGCSICCSALQRCRNIRWWL